MGRLRMRVIVVQLQKAVRGMLYCKKARIVLLCLKWDQLAARDIKELMTAFRNSQPSSRNSYVTEKTQDMKIDAEKMNMQKKMKEASKQAIMLIKLKSKDSKFSASTRFALSVVKRDQSEEAEESSMNTRRDIAERRYKKSKKKRLHQNIPQHAAEVAVEDIAVLTKKGCCSELWCQDIQRG